MTSNLCERRPPEGEETQLDIALGRIEAEAREIDPEAAVARFNSAW
jgi:hypothetical protein